MLSLKSLLSLPYGYYSYIWVDVTLIKETPKAIFIDFDNRKAGYLRRGYLKLKKRVKSIFLKEIFNFFLAKTITKRIIYCTTKELHEISIYR